MGSLVCDMDLIGISVAPFSPPFSPHTLFPLLPDDSDTGFQELISHCKLELMLVMRSIHVYIWLLMSESVQRAFAKVLLLEPSLKQPSQTNVRGVTLSHLI